MSNPKGKKKFVLWAYPSTLQLVESNYKKDNSKSRSEFIERAILFYIGRVNADTDTSYLPTALRRQPPPRVPKAPPRSEEP